MTRMANAGVNGSEFESNPIVMPLAAFKTKWKNYQQHCKSTVRHQSSAARNGTQKPMRLKSLCTEKLLLRQVQWNDSGFIKDYLSDDERTKYLPLERAYSETQAAAWFNGRMQHWEMHKFGSFIVIHKESCARIGYCGIEFVRNTKFVDIRYGVLQNVWGQGLAFEAALHVLRYGFDELRLSTIYGAAVPDNSPSIAILKKLGMSPDRTFNSYGDVVSPFSISKERFDRMFEQQMV